MQPQASQQQQQQPPYPGHSQQAGNMQQPWQLQQERPGAPVQSNAGNQMQHRMSADMGGFASQAQQHQFGGASSLPGQNQAQSYQQQQHGQALPYGMSTGYGMHTVSWFICFVLSVELHIYYAKEQSE